MKRYASSACFEALFTQLRNDGYFGRITCGKKFQDYLKGKGIV